MNIVLLDDDDPPPAMSKMVARWTLDDAGDLVDTIGGLTLTPTGTVGSAAGVIGEARSFAVDGKLSQALPASTYSNVAVEAWVYLNNVTDVLRGIISWGLANTPRIAIQQNGTAISIYLDRNYRFSTTVQAATWYHVVVTKTPTGWAHYINGTPIGVYVGGDSYTNGIFTVGYGYNGYFNGRVDELAIYQFGASGDPGEAFWLHRYNSGAGRRP